MDLHNTKFEPGYDSLESSLEAEPGIDESAGSHPRLGLPTLRFNKSAFLITLVALSTIIVIGIAAFGFSELLTHTGSGSKNNGQQSANYSVGSLPVQNIKPTADLQIGEADHLAINGQLQVNDTIVLAPSAVPTLPVVGQIYYDKTTNQPYYFNGSQFVDLNPNGLQHVTSLGGAAGAVLLGNGLQVSGNTLSIASSVLQSVARAGAGGSSVTSLQGLTGAVTLHAGSGIAIAGTTITNSGVTSLAGTANEVNILTDSGDVTLSLPQAIDPAANVQFNSLVLAGGDLSLAAAAAVHTDNITTVGAGDTITISGDNNITFENASGTNSFTFPTSGGLGQVICTTAITCAAGGGQAVLLEPTGVQTASANKTTVFINKSGGTGNLIELQDAGTDALVVDNAGNTTISKLSVANGLTVTGTTTINTTGTANTSIGNTTGTLALTSAGLNISTAGALTGVTSLTLNGAISGGTSFTGSGNINTTAGAFELNGASINTAGVLGNVAYQNQANTFTLANNQFTAIGTALSVTNNASIGGALTVGTPGTATGSLILGNSANARTVTIQEASQTVGSSTVTIPNTAGVNDTVCLLTLANCVGTGGGISGTGVAGTIAEFNGANSLTNSPLTDAAGNLTSTGSLTTVGLNSGTGLLQGTGGLTVTGTTTINTTGTANTSIGNTTGTLALTSAGLNISTAGALTGVTSLTLNGAISGGTSFTGSGNINTTAGAFELNGASINTAGVLGNVAYQNQANTFTLANNQFTAIGTALSVTNNASIGGALTVGTPGTATGSLILGNSANARTVTIQEASQTVGSSTVTIPNTAGVNDTVCLLTLANCVGTGGGISGTGVAGTIAEFNGANSLTNSPLTDAAGNLTSTGSLTTVGLNSGTGLLQGTGGLTVTGTTTINTTGTANTSIGNTTGTLALTSAGLNISTAGALTGVTSLTLNGAISGGTSFTGSGNINTTAGAFELNGASINTAGVLGNVAYQNQANTFTLANNQFTAIGTALSVTNNASIGGALTVGTPGTATGSLILGNSANARTVTIQEASQTVGSSTVTIPNTAGVNDTVCLLTLANCVGTGGGISGTGVAGTIAEFNGANSLTNSPLTDAAGNLTSTGSLTTVGLNSGTGLLQGTGGLTVTGTTTINTTGTANTSIGNTTGTLALTSAGLNISTAGALTGVTSLTLNGAISGGTSFTGSGNINTTAGAFELNGASINTAGVLGNVAYQNQANTFTLANNQFTAIGTALSVTNNASIGGALTVGTPGTATGSLILGNSANARTVTIQEASQTVGSSTVTIPNTAGVNDTVCLLTLANCVGTGGGISGTGVAGTIAEFNGANSLTNSPLTDAAGNLTSTGSLTTVGLNSGTGLLQGTGGLTVTGTTTINTTGTANTSIGNTTGTLALTSAGLNISTAGALTGVTSLTLNGAISGGTSFTGSGNINTTAGAFELNGASINTAGVLGNVAYQNQANTFTLANNQFTAIGTALSVTNNASIGGALTVGTPGTATGSLILGNSANARTVTIQEASQTVGSSTVTIPNTAGVNDTVCLLTLANCVGTGGGISGTGVAGTIAEFNGANSLTNSPLTDAAGNLTSTGSLTTVGLNSGTGLLQGTGGLTVTGTTTINTTGTANTSIGNTTGTLALTSAGLNISTAGALTGVTSLTLNGAISGGTSFTGSGNINTTAGAFELNGASINTAGVLGNVAYQNQANTFTLANNQFTAIGTALSVTNNASIGGALTVGTPGTATGSLILGNSANARTVTIQEASQTVGSSTVTIPNTAGVNDTVCLLTLANCVGTGGGISGTGVAGTIAEFNGANSLTNSPLTDAAGNLTSTGSLTTVGLNSGTGLLQGTGGLTVTGTTTINTTGTANTSIGNTTGTLALTSAGLNISTAGALTGVTSLTLNGAISGGTSFTGSGNINTTAGAFELNGASINTAGVLGNVAYQNQANTFTLANNQFTAIGTALSVTNNASIGGALTVGTPGTATGSLILGNSANARTVTIQEASQTVGSSTVTIPNTAGVNDTVCLLTLANCVGTGGGISGTGVAGTIAEFNGANSLTNSPLTDAAGNLTSTGSLTTVGLNSGTGLLQGTGGLTVTGTTTINTTGTANTSIGNTTGTLALTSAGLNISTAGALTGVTSLTLNGAISGGTSFTGSGNINTTAGAFELNGASINTAGVLGNVAYQNQANTFTLANNQFTAIGTALSVTNNASIGGALTVGTPGTATGSLILGNSANARTVTIQEASQTVGSSTVTIPNTAGVNDTVCLLTLANCVGTGGGISGTGVAGTIAIFSSSSALGDSLLTESGTTVTVAASAIFENPSNSTTAFQIQNSGGIPELTVDTSGNRLALGNIATSNALQGSLVLSDGTTDNFGATIQTTGSLSGNSTFQLGVGSANGTYQICTTLSVCTGYAPASGSGNYVQLAPASAQADSSTNSSIFINKTGASGNILELQKGAADVLTVGNTGSVISKNSANSTTAFQIQNAAGSQLFNLDTTADASDLITNADFEQNTAGWSGYGTGPATITTSATAHLYGAQSMAVTTTTNAGDGAKYPIALSPNTAYTLDVAIYSTSLISINSLAIGYSDTGVVGGEPDFTQNTTTINANTWVHTYLSFTTGATVNGGAYVYIKQNGSGTARTFYVDGVDLEQTSGGGIQYHDGTVQLTGAITSPLVVQSPVNNNNTAAFAVLSSSGVADLAVDTVNNQVLIGTMSGFGKLTVVSGSSSNPQIGARFVTNGTNTDDTEQVESDNSSGTQANGIFFNRNQSGGTTTNGLNVTDTLGNLTNGLAIINADAANTLTTGIALTATNAITTGISFSGAGGFTNLISAPNFAVSNAGVITLQGNQANDITVAAQATGNTAGNNLTLGSSAGNGTGTGGTLTLQAAASGNGATGNGGALNITAGSASSTNGTGGTIILTAGTGSGSGSNGSVLIPFVSFGTTKGSTTALQVGGLTNPIFTVDNSGNHVIAGATGSCAGPGAGRFCVNQAVTSGSGTVVNQNNSETISGGTGFTSYNNYINLTDTNTGVSNTDNIIYSDASGTTNSAASINTLTAKVTSGQTGNFVQLTNGSATVLTIANNGTSTFENSANSTSAFQVQNASAASVLNVDTTNSILTVATATNGGSFINNGSTLNTAKSLGNFSSNGSIGTAAATVDIYTTFVIPQITGSISLTVPNPTNATAGRVIYIANTGSVTVTVAGITLTAGSNMSLLWNGSAWTSTAVSTGVTIVGAFAGVSQTNGATISGNTITFGPADINGPGMVTNGTQTFAGNKAFESTTNSTTAFQIQNSAGTSLLTADTTDNQLVVTADEEDSGFIDDNGIGGFGTSNNFLGCSEEFDTGNGCATGLWVYTNIATPSADTVIAPNAFQTAEVLVGTGNSKVLQTETVSHAAGTYTFSVWLKQVSGAATTGLCIYSAGGTPSTCTTTVVTPSSSGWQRFFITQAITGSPTSIKVEIHPGNGSTASVDAWGAQLVPGTSEGVYVQTVGGTPDTDGTGVLVANDGISVAGGFAGFDSFGNLEGILITSSDTITANSFTSGDTSLDAIQNSAGAAVPVAIIQGGATPGAAADLLQFRDSSSNILAGIDNAGNVLTAGNFDTENNTNLNIGIANATGVTIGNAGVNNTTTIQGLTVIQTFAANSPTAFQVQNTGGADVLNVDTTNGRLIVGTGSTGEATAKLLVLDNETGGGAEPTGVNGAMYYNVTMNQFRCFVNGIWQPCNSPLDAAAGYNIDEEFIGDGGNTGRSENCNGTGTAWADFSYDWDCNSDSGNHGAAYDVAADTYQHPGQVELTTGTGATPDWTEINLGNEGNTTTINPFIIGGGETMEMGIKLPHLSSASDRYIIRLGLCDVDTASAGASPAACSNGVWFEYSDNVNGGDWQFKTAAGGTTTTGNSSKALATGWWDLKAVANSSTSVSFYAKGPSDTSYTLLGTNSTNVPNTAAHSTGAVIEIQKTSNTTPADLMDVDYFQLYNSFTGLR